MEDTLTQLLKESTKYKQVAISQACQDTLELLQDKAIAAAAQPHHLR